VKNQSNSSPPPADLDDQGHGRGPHRARGGGVRRAGVLLRDRGTAPPDWKHEPHRHLHPDVGDQLLHPIAQDARQGHRAPPVHQHQRAAGLSQVHRGRQGGRVRPHAAPGPPLAELGQAREAQDHHAGSPRPDRERAERSGVRFQPADLQVLPDRNHVQPDAPAPRAQRGRLPFHRPRRRRAPERLRHPERHSPEGDAHGRSPPPPSSCTGRPAAGCPRTRHPLSCSP